MGYVRVFGQVRERKRERRCNGGEEKSSFPVVALPGKKKIHGVKVFFFFFNKQCIKQYCSI